MYIDPGRFSFMKWLCLFLTVLSGDAFHHLLGRSITHPCTTKLHVTAPPKQREEAIFEALLDLFINPTLANQNSRKVENRSYAANKASFSRDPPYSLNDLDYLSTDNVTPNALPLVVNLIFKYGLLFLLGWFGFPIIVQLIEPFTNESTVTVATSINGVSVLFGTLISITYSILFNRQSQLQDAATKESATLSYLARAISDWFDVNSHLFSINDKMDHLQYIWQHCVTLVGKSRAFELVQILEADPLMNLQSMLQNVEVKADAKISSSSSSSSLAPGSVSSLNRIRDQIVVLHDQVPAHHYYTTLVIYYFH